MYINNNNIYAMVVLFTKSNYFVFRKSVIIMLELSFSQFESLDKLALDLGITMTKCKRTWKCLGADVPKKSGAFS